MRYHGAALAALELPVQMRAAFRAAACLEFLGAGRTFSKTHGVDHSVGGKFQVRQAEPALRQPRGRIVRHGSAGIQGSCPPRQEGSGVHFSGPAINEALKHSGRKRP